MVTLLATMLVGQLYSKELSVGFARETSIAPPLPISSKSKFAVSVYNGTKVATKILSDECSWGYESLSFELKSPSGKITSITRKPKEWYRNFPMGKPLESIGMDIRRIDLGDKTWQGIPRSTGETTGWQIKAKLTVAADKLISGEGFWTGKIESGWTPARLTD